MITLENIETLKKKINEKANKEIEKLSSTYKIIQSIQKYYPSIAERLEEIPFKLEYGKPAFWVKLNIDTFHEALALIENLEFYPLPLFSRKNGCLSIMENLEEENLLKDGDTNLGFMLIHYESNNYNWKTTQEVEVRLGLNIEKRRLYKQQCRFRKQQNEIKQYIGYYQNWIQYHSPRLGLNSADNSTIADIKIKGKLTAEDKKILSMVTPLCFVRHNSQNKLSLVVHRNETRGRRSRRFSRPELSFPHLVETEI